LWSVSAEASLTASPTGQADTKVGASDPVVEGGIAIAQRIIGTLGITGLSGSRVHIDSPVWHLKYWGVSTVTSEMYWLITVEPKKGG